MTVDALLPLSLLEAVRDVDRAPEDLDAEFVSELRNKRFGLSDTVYAQIRRYADAVRRSQRQRYEEVAGLARLIGRRPDADAVFRAGGRYLARHAYDTVPALTRSLLSTLPGLVARPLALRTARRLARRYFGGTVARSGAALVLEVTRPVLHDAAPNGAACVFYEAGLGELLHLLVQRDPGIDHVTCLASDDARCAWRAVWSA